MSTQDDKVIDIRSRPRSQRAPVTTAQTNNASSSSGWTYPEPAQKPLMGEALQQWILQQRQRRRDLGGGHC